MKYCKKCKKSYPDSKSFCEECGSKLTEMTEKVRNVKPENKSNKLKWMIPVGIVGILLIIGLILIWFTTYSKTTTSSITGGVITPTKNCYTVQEPYTVQIPYTYSYKYSVIDHTLTSDWNIQLGDFKRAKMTLANSEDNGGSFTITYSFITLDGTTKDTKSLYIPAHSTQTFEFIFDSKIGQDVRGNYEVVPPTETRYTEEVRYRNVEKCD